MERYTRVNGIMRIDEKTMRRLRTQAWAAVIALALLFFLSEFPIGEFIVVYANY